LFCSCLLHACSRACSVQWWAQSRNQLKSISAFMSATRCRAYCLLNVKSQSSIKLEDELLSCDMYEALNNVRIMLKASHRNTSKSRVNEINENSKLKSKIYWDAKTICTEERKALSSIKS